MSVLAPLLKPSDLSALTASRPDVRVLDVRTPGDFESVHIRGAYNVPLDTLSEHSAEISGVSAPVILVCQSGGRARRAEAALKAAGMANLHVLEGGMGAWEIGRASCRERVLSGAMAGAGNERADDEAEPARGR